MDKSVPQKAFIFDLDGVLIDGEPLWEKAKKEIFVDLFGKEIYIKMRPSVGISMEGIYERAVQLGAKVTQQQVFKAFEKYALAIYSTTPITEGINNLGHLLIHKKYAIGIVSSSPKHWMNLVINRLSFKNDISIVISLKERGDLKQKPAPDGYLEAIKQLRATPSTTLILEDSNGGIASAKAAGAHVIGLRQNLIPGYVQEGADMYVDTVDEVILIVKNFNPSH